MEVMRALEIRARSIKPGNITLRLERLLEVLSTGALGLAGAQTAPWTIFFAVILFWHSLERAAEIQLDQLDAAVLYGMWKNHQDRLVPKKELLAVVNRELAAVGLQQMDFIRLSTALDSLQKLKVISSSNRKPNYWYMSEWVKITYR